MQWQSTILKWSFWFSLQTTTQAKNAPKKRRPVFPYIMHPTSPTPCEFGKYVCFQRASEEVSAESASLLRVVSMLLENCLPTQLELWSKWVQVRYWGCWYRVVVKICHIGLIRYLVRSLNFTPSLSWAKIPCRYLYVYMLTYNNIYIYIFRILYTYVCVTILCRYHDLSYALSLSLPARAFTPSLGPRGMPISNFKAEHLAYLNATLQKSSLGPGKWHQPVGRSDCCFCFCLND